MFVKAPVTFITIAIIMTIGAFPVSGGECIKVASGSMEGVIKRIAPDVMRVLKLADICHSYQIMPIKRVQRDMIRGDIDIEFIRVKSYIDDMKDHVVAVPTPLISGRGMVITLKSSGFHPSSLADLENKLIGYVSGTKWHLALISKIKRVKKSSSYTGLIRLMRAGRIDGLLIDNVTLDTLTTRKFFQDQELHRSFPVVDLSGYIVVHKSKKALIEKIDQAVKKVKKEGGFKLQ